MTSKLMKDVKQIGRAVTAAALLPALAVWAAVDVLAPANATADAEELGAHIEIDLSEILAETEVKQRAVMNFPARDPNPPGIEALQVPEGFKVNVYADGDYRQLRNLVFAPDGSLFVVDSQVEAVYVLNDTDNDGDADTRTLFVDGLDKPFGVAFMPGYVYIANTGGVLRWPYEPGQTEAQGEGEVIVPELPAQGQNNHWTRNLIFNEDHTKLYITVGSATNVSEEPLPRASILQCNPDGSELKVFASGLRNPVGLAWCGDELWTTVNERDLLGDELVPDYATAVEEGEFYGWPWFFIGDHVDPRMEDKIGDAADREVAIPDLLIQAHSAALGMVFYEGEMFPEEYQGDLFMAFHGSWNRAPRTGYKVVRAKMENCDPVGGYENFLVGWLPEPDSPTVWGRPVMLAVAPDGALLVTDDMGNKIWRVSYSAPE